jgi:hypothetical protein
VLVPLAAMPATLLLVAGPLLPMVLGQRP